jgi:benzoylformate decarboxylase
MPCRSWRSLLQHAPRVLVAVGPGAILKECAMLEKTPNVPALDLPELDIVSTTKGFGCAAVATYSFRPRRTSGPR